MDEKLTRAVDFTPSKALATSNALSFFTENGGSILSKQDSAKDKPKLLPNFCLKLPSDNAVTAVADVASKFNSNIEDVKEIIINILQTCLFFRISDVNQISYILATISHEARFGATMVENDGYLLHLYEPVFSDQQAKDDLKPIKKGNASYFALKDVEINLLGKVKYLYQNYKGGDLAIDEGEELLDDLHQNTDEALAKVDDTFLTPYLTAVNSGEFSEVVKSFITKKITHLFPERSSTPYVQIILSKITSIDPAKASSIVLKFFTLQLKILLIDWLLTRIGSSTNLGNTCEGDGEAFKGRGLVQLTGRYNYNKFNTFFQAASSNYAKASANLGMEDIPDLEDNSTSVADKKIASIIAVGGMAEGKFRGSHRLSQYSINNSSLFDFVGARDIINGDKNSSYNHTSQTVGEHVADIAKSYIPALLTP